MKRFCCLCLVSVASCLPAFSAGFIILHGPHHWPSPLPRPDPPPRIQPRPAPEAPIQLRNLQSKVQIEDQVAHTTLEHTFHNPNSRQLEGTFLFPVPKGAQLDKFSMTINGNKVEAELLAADKARSIYEEIVRARKDPALLEYADRDVYKLRVFPIAAQSEQRLEVSYTQVLAADAGLINYVMPLAGESRPRQLAVDIQLHSSTPLKALYSPSHSVEIKRIDDHRARIGFESGQGHQPVDFELLFSRDEAPLGLNLLAHRSRGEEGYFLLLLNTSLNQDKVQTVAKDILFVLDTSGSMAGAKLDQAKKSLLFCIENLNSNDRFDIIRFSTEVEPLFGKLSEPDETRRAQARTFVDGLKPIGGTAIEAALQQALASIPADPTRPCHVIFLTDGLPTVGVTDADQIVRGITREDKTRIFCFGIGTDVNTRLLDRIAETTRAVSQYVLPEEDLELKISSFFSKIKEPALTDPELVFPDKVRVSKLYPTALPDLFKGQQLILVGRYQGDGSGQLLLNGKSNAKLKTDEYTIEFPTESTDHAFLPRLWATRRVGFLLDEIRLRGESQELKDETADLARRYGIVTPYTAYLIIEDERRRDVPTARRSLSKLEQEPRLVQQSSQNYRLFAQDEKGDAAVAGARASQALRLAATPADAIDTFNLEVARAQIAPAEPHPAQAFRSSVTLSPAAKRYAERLQITADAFTQQTRFAGGRTFYQNSGQWIDQLSQNAPNGTTRKIQFGSAEYFALATAHPEMLPWLSLGTHVTFTQNDTTYIIHD